MSLFSQVTAAPPDPILGLTEAFVADQRPGKVNLGVGVYQDESGKVPVLEATPEQLSKAAEKSTPSKAPNAAANALPIAPSSSTAPAVAYPPLESPKP